MACCIIQHYNIYLALELKFFFIIFITHFAVDYMKCMFLEYLENDYEMPNTEKDIADTNLFYIDQLIHIFVLAVVFVLLNHFAY
jgi:hypothetical protein